MSGDNKGDVKKTGGEEIDQELSELLDSALADFPKEGDKKKAEVEKKDDVEESKVEEAPTDEVWAEDLIRQAAEQFESNINALLGGNDGNAMNPEQMQLSFQRMAEAAQQAISNPGIDEPASMDFASAISQTLTGLSQGTENLQNPFSENDIMSMFSNMTTGAEGEQNAFMPFMQGMMQSLLSKEVLYPSLKAILEQYPEWLQKNQSTLSPEDIDRYKKQQELMQNVCNELENESETDGVDIRKERFDRVLKLMQTLQDYGQPPSEIVGDVPPGVPFDTQGNPDQCSLM